MNAKRDVERFHEWSATYEHSWIQRYLDELHKVMFDSVAANYAALAPQTILDVGCGTGRLLREAGRHWPAAQLIGVDPAPGMLEVAQKLTPNATFHQGFAESLPIGDANIDLALSAVSMHHWENAGLGIREVSRVLCERGLFCLADITLPAFVGKLFHSKAKSRAVREDLLRNAGFTISYETKMYGGFILISLATKALSAA